MLLKQGLPIRRRHSALAVRQWLVSLLVIAVVTAGQRGWADSQEAPRQRGQTVTTVQGQNARANTSSSPEEMHASLFIESRYPSAKSCAECHPGHYREWSVSSHAYAQISPVFNAMQGTVNKLTNGTTGDFCIRCHSSVGMALNEPVFGSNIDRHPVSREGVTCITCHRVDPSYGKVNARFTIKAGDITDPVYGSTGNEAFIREAIAQGTATTDSSKPGRKIHRGAQKFFQLTTAASCGMCHDVTLASGFREIEAFSDYKASGAAKRGVTCQDCHMGVEPGKYTGDPKTNYEWGAVARVGNQRSPKRKRTNHMMVGVDLPIVHPALFPHHRGAIKEEGDRANSSAKGMATIRQWLEFDWQAGWGTDAFEDEVSPDMSFPERWASIDDRYDARSLIDDNLTLLDEFKRARTKLLRHGYKLGEPIVEQANDGEIRFKIDLNNGTDGHSVPTSLDAERLVWLHVVVTDRDGNIVMESGDLDPNGDVRDLYSAYVRNGELPLDEQLFSLQSRFISRNLRGGEREQVLTVNTSQSPLPFVRPSRRAGVLLGRPVSFRKHKKSIEPLGRRWARYSARGEGLNHRSPYHVTVELKAAVIPVNLVNAIKDVGFDYGMTPRQVADRLVALHEVIWSKNFDIVVTP